MQITDVVSTDCMVLGYGRMMVSSFSGGWEKFHVNGEHAIFVNLFSDKI
jgi:hypothetical protein